MRWDEPAQFSWKQRKECRERIDDAKLVHLTVLNPTTRERVILTGLVSEETVKELLKIFKFAGPDMQTELPL